MNANSVRRTMPATTIGDQAVTAVWAVAALKASGVSGRDGAARRGAARVPSIILRASNSSMIALHEPRDRIAEKFQERIAGARGIRGLLTTMCRRIRMLSLPSPGRGGSPIPALAGMGGVG